MNRRRVLLAIGAALAGSGCTGRLPGEASPSSVSPATESETPSPTPADPTPGSPSPSPVPETSTHTPSTPGERQFGEQFTTDDRTTVTVSNPRVQAMVVEFNEIHTDVVAVAGAQFLVVDVDIAGGGITVTDLELTVEVDGTPAPMGRRYYFVHAPDRPGSQLAFPVPSDPAPETVSVVWPREEGAVRWMLDDQLVSALGAAPAFTVESFTVPDRVDRGAAFEVTYSVSNDGDREGTFRTEIGSALISDHREYAIQVPVGETVTNRVTLDPHVPENTESFEVVMDWGRESMSRTVSVN